VGWGAPRTHSELLKLGIQISESSVSKYMVRHPKPPSQTWRTFLKNHSKQLVSVDFFTVPTAFFQVLFVFYRDPTGSPPAGAFQCDRKSDGVMDGAADSGSFSFRNRTEVLVA
jgi:hypothetical protein